MSSHSDGRVGVCAEAIVESAVDRGPVLVGLCRWGARIYSERTGYMRTMENDDLALFPPASVHTRSWCVCCLFGRGVYLLSRTAGGAEQQAAWRGLHHLVIDRSF